MHDTGFVDLEINLTLLHLLDGLCNIHGYGDAEAAAKEAGADYVGLDEYLQKIKEGWTDVDVIITQPSVMGKLGPLGRTRRYGR